MENNFNIASGSISDRGLSEKRPENEDSFLVLGERGLFAVADGVGGAQAGDVASQMAMEILGEAFINHPDGHDVEDTMRMSIDRANKAIFQMASDLPQLSSMATTVVALHVSDNIATIGHVGDSRAYRVDAAGRIHRETDDHSVVEEEVRAGRMTAEQAQHHPSKNVISRALGAEPEVEIDLKTIMVEPGTTFLLCSDGITRHIEDYELQSFLGMEADPDEICMRLKDLCYERGAEDNLTAVIVRVGAGAGEQVRAAAAAGSDEESTVASARSASAVKDGEQDSEDFSRSETLSIDTLSDDSYLMEDPDDLVDDEGRQSELDDYSSSSVVVPAADTSSSSEFSYPRIMSSTDLDDDSPSMVSKALSTIALLVLGGLIGAGGYYLWERAQPAPVASDPPIPITEMKSANAPLTAFEEGRRIVDKDPVKYIQAKGATAPDTPEDYFLLGRAHLLNNNYWEAKRYYREAREKLPAADPNNAKTLAAEIAMALAIIESGQASDFFKNDVAGGNANSNSPPVSNPATVVNSAGTNRPVR